MRSTSEKLSLRLKLQKKTKLITVVVTRSKYSKIIINRFLTSELSLYKFSFLSMTNGQNTELLTRIRHAQKFNNKISWRGSITINFIFSFSRSPHFTSPRPAVAVGFSIFVNSFFRRQKYLNETKYAHSPTYGYVLTVYIELYSYPIPVPITFNLN